MWNSNSNKQIISSNSSEPIKKLREKVTDVITIPIKDIKSAAEQFTPNPSPEVKNQIKGKDDKKNLNEDQLNKAALLLGKNWFTGSDKHEKENIVQEVINNIDKPLLIYLFTSKGGPLASSENIPDLGEIIFLARVGKVVKKLTLVDEFPSFGFNIWKNSNLAYIKRLSDLAKQFGIELEIKNIKDMCDEEKFNEINKFISLEGKEFRERAAVLFRALIRENSEIDLSVIKKIIEFTAIMQSRRPDMFEDGLYSSIVKGEGKLNVGWPFGLLFIHGVPLIFEHKEKMSMQIVLENELEITNRILKEKDKEIKIFKVVDEHGNFLAFAIKKGEKIEEKDVLDAVKNSLEKKAKEGSTHPITDILEELGVHKNQIEAIKEELEKIKEKAIINLNKILEDAKKTLKSEDDVHGIELFIEEVHLLMMLRNDVERIGCIK